MNTQKLQEALQDLQEKKSLIEQAISAIRRTISMMDGESDNGRRLPTVAASSPEGSYINDAVEILTEASKPLHIDEFVKRISELRGEEMDRPPIESSFSRHLRKTKHPRIVRTSPGYYGLPEWKKDNAEENIHGAA